MSHARGADEVLRADLHTAAVRLEGLALVETGLRVHQVRHLERMLSWVPSDGSHGRHTLDAILFRRHDALDLGPEAVFTAVIRHGLSP